MGKAIPKLIKSRARELIKKFPDSFGPDFEENKSVIRELNFPFSKVDLNILAGYLGRIKKKEIKEELISSA